MGRGSGRINLYEGEVSMSRVHIVFKKSDDDTSLLHGSLNVTNLSKDFLHRSAKMAA